MGTSSDRPAPAPPLNPVAAGLEPSLTVKIWQRGFGREGVIPLYVGEGDLPTPDFICAAAERALAAGQTFYTPKRGLPELRQALSDYKQRHFAVAVDPERITVTSSGMNAIMMILQAVLAPGRNLVVPTPVWPNILAAAEIAGGELRTLAQEALPEGGFRLDLDRLFARCDAATAAIFLVSPSNPTGWVISPEEQQTLLDFCRARGIWLVADEVYHRFVYDAERFPSGVAPSFLQLAEPEDPLLVVNSFSKTWCMTGWRQGWITHPARLAPVFDNLVEFNTSGGQAFLQRGCLAALTEGEDFVERLVARCATAAGLVHDRLSTLPRVRTAKPAGAFYSFFRVEGMGDSLAFAERLLDETGVGLAPGAAFGPGGEGHLRLCFASAPARLSEALDRIGQVLS